MTPIEKIIAELPMTPVAGRSDDIDTGIPYVTHEGVLQLAGCELRVFQLSNGKRVISAKDVHKMFGL
jgi:hypothetical protein